jgi:hypothetical protein
MCDTKWRNVNSWKNKKRAKGFKHKKKGFKGAMLQVRKMPQKRRKQQRPSQSSMWPPVVPLETPVPELLPPPLRSSIFTPPDINLEHTQVLRVHPEDEEVIAMNDDVQVMKIHDYRDPDVHIEELLTTDTEAEEREARSIELLQQTQLAQQAAMAAQSAPEMYTLPQLNSERPKRSIPKLNGGAFPDLMPSPVKKAAGTRARTRSNARQTLYQGPSVLNTSLLRASSAYNLTKANTKKAPVLKGLPYIAQPKASELFADSGMQVANSQWSKKRRATHLSRLKVHATPHLSKLKAGKAARQAAQAAEKNGGQDSWLLEQQQQREEFVKLKSQWDQQRWQKELQEQEQGGQLYTPQGISRDGLGSTGQVEQRQGLGQEQPELEMPVWADDDGSPQSLLQWGAGEFPFAPGSMGEEGGAMQGPELIYQQSGFMAGLQVELSFYEDVASIDRLSIEAQVSEQQLDMSQLDQIMRVQDEEREGQEGGVDAAYAEAMSLVASPQNESVVLNIEVGVEQWGLMDYGLLNQMAPEEKQLLCEDLCMLLHLDQEEIMVDAEDGSGAQKPVKRLQLVFTQPTSPLSAPVLTAENYKVGGRSLHIKVYDCDPKLALEAYDFFSASDFQMEIAAESWADLGFGPLAGLTQEQKIDLSKAFCHKKLELQGNSPALGEEGSGFSLRVREEPRQSGSPDVLVL